MELSIGNILLLMLGILLMVAGAAWCFIPRRYAPAVCYAGMLVCSITPAVGFDSGTLLFWGIAAAISLGINYMLPANIALSRAGVPYICGGALAGTAIGMTLNSIAAIITGAACGALFGAIAFASTPKGRPMSFPSAKFFNYLAAKGLPAIVVMSMAGLFILAIFKM